MLWWHNTKHASNKAGTANPAALGETLKEIIMFYAIREQQITDTSTEYQLLKFYSKADRASYLEVRGDASIIKAKVAHKFSFRAPSYAVRCPDASIIFFVYTIY